MVVGTLVARNGFYGLIKPDGRSGQAEVLVDLNDLPRTAAVGDRYRFLIARGYEGSRIAVELDRVRRSLNWQR
jgi:hypothetical protein